jgi:hypothetical protein
MRINILNYLDDSGRFANNALINTFAIKCQGLLTFCRLHAHFENGIAATRLRDLQVRTQANYHSSLAGGNQYIPVALFYLLNMREG